MRKKSSRRHILNDSRFSGVTPGLDASMSMMSQQAVEDILTQQQKAIKQSMISTEGMNSYL
jgi:hypothetical protein